MKIKDLKKELIKVTKLRVKAHIIMRMGKPEEISHVLAKLFTIEDNWAFWETVKKNGFYRYDWMGGLVDYYDAVQKWYNNYSKQEKGKDEWLYFGNKKLPWRKEKLSFNNLMMIDEN